MKCYGKIFMYYILEQIIQLLKGFCIDYWFSFEGCSDREVLGCRVNFEEFIFIFVNNL